MIGLKSYFYDFNWSIIYAVTGVMLYSIGLKIVISIVYFMRADNTWVWWTREMTIVYRRFYYRVLSQGICYDKNHVMFANQNKRKHGRLELHSRKDTRSKSRPDMLSILYVYSLQIFWNILHSICNVLVEIWNCKQRGTRD